ncbi:hypothetical protein [Exiguobacterium sp. K1]|uniref:hypothetical protein n=1 Tax=Exiguobacterium sp. K1 TaxID=2980105 RepID=UPI00299DDC4D|nr:hypothetical protein [Exiguobacterium sp. K1]MDX1258483.1 hypothetical protein [Exiguobacterium sp. K1]
MKQQYQVTGAVTVSVQAIEELLLCTVLDFGATVARIKRLSGDSVSFSLKVQVDATRLPDLYHYLREQVNIQLGEDVLDYLQLVAK